MAGMNSPHETLISDCLAYCARHGISPSTFGSYAVKDGKFLKRLMDGGQCLPRTEQRVRDFIKNDNIKAPSNETLTVGSPTGG